MNEGIFGQNGGEFVALGIQFAPQHILQFFKAEARDGRDKHNGKILWQGLSEHFDEFFVEQIAFRDGQYTVFIRQFGIKLRQFIEQDLIFALDVIGIARHHEE